MYLSDLQHQLETPEDGREAKRSAAAAVAAAAAAAASNLGNGPEEMPSSSSDLYKRPRIEQAAACVPFKVEFKMAIAQNRPSIGTYGFFVPNFVLNPAQIRRQCRVGNCLRQLGGL